MNTFVITANNIEELGGAQHVAHRLAMGLAARGHQVHLVGVTPVGDSHEYLFGSESNPYQCHTLMPEIWPEKTASNAKVRTELRNIAVARLRSLLDSLGAARVIATQLWSLEIVLDAIPESATSFPVIGQYHGSFAAAANGRDIRRAQKMAGACEFFAVLSREDASAFAAAGLTNVVHLANPTTLTADQFQRALEVPRGSTIDYVGRLSIEKGPDLLLDAWQLSKPPGFTLRITGSGPMQSELERRHCVDVDFHAPVTDIAPTLAQSRVVVIPSRTEGAPLVLAESLALGTPVVVTDVSSGIREMVTGNPRAVLVERDNPEALAEGIRVAIELAPDPRPIYPDDSDIFEQWEQLFATGVN